MAATELNFGPEWLRALTDGASKNATTTTTTNNNSSNSLNNTNTSSNGTSSLKTKMASKSSSSSSSCSSSNKHHWSSSEIKYRYSKEEMLSYFNRSLTVPPPKDLMQHDEVFVEDCQNPLAFIELSTDEINLLSQSINSDFVLKKSSSVPEQQNNNAGQNQSGGGNGGSMGNNHSISSTNTTNTHSTYKDQIHRMKMLNISNPSASSDLLVTRGSSGERSSKLGTNGFINSDRITSINPYPLRSGGGNVRGSSIVTERSGPSGLNGTRSGFRSTSNIVFTRLSSMDSDNTGSGSSTSSSTGKPNSSTSVFIAKKGSGLQQRSSTISTSGENNSGSSSSSSSLFMPPWRSGSISGCSSTTTSTSMNSNNQTNEPKESSWKSSSTSCGTTTNCSTNGTNNSSSSSEVLKSWRNDIASSGTNPPAYSSSGSNSLSKIGSLQRKDFFADSLDSGTDHHEISGRIIGGKSSRNLDVNSSSNNANSNKSSKAFNKRSSFITSNSGSSEHHRDHIHHSSNPPYDGSMLDAERDLFGGRTTSTTTCQTSSASNYGDLFARTPSSGTNGGTKTAVLNSRYSRDHHRDGSSNNTALSSNSSTSYQMDNNSKSNHYSSTKGYDRERSGPGATGSYHRSSTHQQYDRFTRSSTLSGNGGSQSSYSHSNHHQNDDSDFFMDRFAGRGSNAGTGGTNTGHLTSSDDDDYRRKDSLPEWSLEDPSCIDITRVGTFDASGAFHEALEDENAEDGDQDDFFKNENSQSCNNKKEDISKQDNVKIQDNKIRLIEDNTAADTIENSHRITKQNSEVRPEQTSSTQTRTTVSSTSKPKTIDYFNDPSLSPNYNAREETNKQRLDRNDVDHTRRKNLNNFSNTTNVMIGSEHGHTSSVNNINNSATNDQIKNEDNCNMTSEDVVTQSNQRYNHQNNLVMIKEDGNGSNENNILANTSESFNQNQNHGNSFVNESRFGTIISAIGKQQLNPSNVTTSTTILNSSTSSRSALLAVSENESSPSRTAFKSTSSLFNEDLLNDQLKLSSLLKDFNFDFGVTSSTTNVVPSSSSSGNNPVASTTNNNNADQLFLRLTSQQQNNHNTSFMNNNNVNQGSSSQASFSASSNTASSSFETNSLLNLVDSATSDDQQPFGGQRFSNLLSSQQSKQQVSLAVKDNTIDHLPMLNMSNTKWFYCDPQGQTQGPFTNQEMYDWYNGGYFSPELLVKPGTYRKFIKLGDMIQGCGGRCPFIVVPRPNNQNVPSVAPPQSQPTPPIGPANHQTTTTNFAIRNDGLFTSFLQNHGQQQVLGSTSSTAPIPVAAPVASHHHQQPHSAPIVPSAMINQFLTSSQQAPQASPPAVAPSNLSSHHSFGSTGTAGNSFQFDDVSIMNSFSLFQNLSKQPDSGTTIAQMNMRSTAGTNSLPEDPLLTTTSEHLIDHMIQHQQRAQQQSGLVGVQGGQLPPNSSVPPENQMRLFLNHLMQQQQPTSTTHQTTKDELLTLNTHQQREQYLLEKFQQFNLTYNKDQLRQALNDQYHLNTNVGSNVNTSQANVTTDHQMIFHQIDEDQLSTASSSGGGGVIGTGRTTNAKKLSLDETATISRVPPGNNGQIPLQQLSQQPSQLQRAQSYEPAHANFVSVTQQQAHQMKNHSFPPQHAETAQSDLITKSDDALQLLKKYAGTTPSTSSSNNVVAPASWIGDNFVPGALSVTDVEELQRREAEERYHQRNQQQAKHVTEELMDYQFDGADSNGEFIEVDRNKQKHRQQQNKQQSQKQKNISVVGNKQESLATVCKPVAITPQQQQASPQPPRTPPAMNIIPQMPQLPKKAVWGNPTNHNENSDQQQPQAQPLSIAEIQRLQEEKEEEERRLRQEQQMQMNAALLHHQQQQQRSMKWASQPWQEQNHSQIKTLAEIQAEEAEKQAALMRQQQQQQQEALEVQARRRQTAVSSMTPLSVIVAKGSNPQSAWNNGSLKSSGAWDEDDQQTIQHQTSLHNNSTMSQMTTTTINYKNAVAAGQKSSARIDSASLRQILKTNPKVKKSEDFMMMVRNDIDTPEELFRCCVELLNKHFDSIDAFGFMNIVKDLGSPGEVSEYCQSYLGNNPVSMYFSKFFISKKTFLIKMKQQQQQEQERNKQQQSIKKNSWNNNGSSSNHNEDHNEDQSHQQRVINYKSALNNNNHSKVSNKNDGNSRLNNTSGSNTTSSAHIKPATLKTQISNNISKSLKGNDDVNLMTIQVESMEEFDKWCLDVLKLNFELNIDAETFINFLKDIASPDEINDYVQTYLGSNKISRDFAKNFISKRSYLRNKAKQNEPYEDMCGPAPALTPLINNDNNGFVTVSSSNKKKRSKNKNQNHQNE